MGRVRFILFMAHLIICAVIIGALGLPTLLRRGWAMKLSKLWCVVLDAGLFIWGGIKRDVRGLDKLPAGPAIIAAKHQSMWETIALMRLLPVPTFVLKQELMRIPIIGWWFRADGFIAVDRNAGPRALKQMVSDAQASLAQGTTHIIIFPEGTRVPVGETGRYQPGIAALAQALGLPIVPVAHNSGLHWQHHNRALQPGTVALEFLNPLPQDLPRRKVVAALEQIIEPATRRLEGLTSPPPHHDGVQDTASLRKEI